ncbi:MAG: hypothetical protein ACP5I8_12265 [Phycisphaerae bacterium]
MSSDDEQYDEEDWKIENHIHTAVCPYCHKTIFDDTPRCPFCGQYLTSRQLLRNNRSGWKIFGIIMLFLALAMFLLTWLLSPPW